MKDRISENYFIESFNEEESFSLGGLWQGNYRVNDFTLPGKYLLENTLTIDEIFCALAQIELLGKWRNDIKFSIVIVDTSSKRVLKSKNNFTALSILKIANGFVFFTEAFNAKEVESSKSFEINDGNFVRIAELP